MSTSFFKRFTMKRASSLFKVISLILLGVVTLGFIVFYIFRSQAPRPMNVRVTNITDRSFTVSWITEKPAIGVVLYTEESGPLAWSKARGKNGVAYDDRDVSKAELESAKENWESVLDTGYRVKPEKYYTHHVTLKGLEPDKEYKFKVGDRIHFFNPQSELANDFNKATSYQIKTLPTLDKMSVAPNPAYGNVRAKTADSDYNRMIIVSDGLFYAKVVQDNSEYILSSVVNAEGRWYMDLSGLRDEDGEIVEIDSSVKDYKAFVDGGVFGSSEVITQPYEKNAPADDIVIETTSVDVLEEVSAISNLIKPVYANKYCPEGLNEITDSSKCGCTKGENRKVRCYTNDGSMDWCVDTGVACVESDATPRVDSGSPGGGADPEDTDLDPDDLEFLYDEEICIEDVTGPCNYKLHESHNDGCGICCKTKWQHVYKRKSDGAVVTSDAGRESDYHGNDSECGRAEPKEEQMFYYEEDRKWTFSCCYKDYKYYTSEETNDTSGSICHGGTYVGQGKHEKCEWINCKYDNGSGRTICDFQRRGNCKGEEVSSCHGLSMKTTPIKESSLLAFKSSAAEKVQIVGSETVLEAQEDGVYQLTIPGEEKQYEVILEKGKTYVFYKDENKNGVQDNGEEVINLQEDAVELFINDEEKIEKVVLNQGLNFIAFNVVPKNIDSCEFLKEINNGKSDEQLITQISRFDSGKFEVTSYRKDTEQPVAGTCFPVVAGRGYILKTFGSTEITYSGYPLTKPVELVFGNPGWHLIGINGTQKQYTADSLLLSINETENLTANNLTRWKSEASKYEGLQKDLAEDGGYSSYGFDFPISPSESYFLRVISGEGRWTPGIEVAAE